MKSSLGALLGAALSSLAQAAPATPSFAERPEVVAFAQDLQNRHGLAADQLLDQFSRLHANPRVLQLIKPPVTPAQRSWERYRPRFLNERRIEGGARFWEEHAGQLAKAAALYGVPEAVIVAIIGVETEYGRNTGGFKVMEALATLAFDYPPRAEFFRTELEQFLLLARENSLDPLAVKGSYAGAIGIPQFMPGSQRRYAIDFDGDQRVDLSDSVDDAIGSVARFLEQHGWQAGQPVAQPAALDGEPDPRWREAGLRPSLKVAELAAAGVVSGAPAAATVSLIDLESPGLATEYWLGYENFYVITRYNRSSFYAMAVFQLAEAVRERVCARQPATGENPARYCRA